MSDQDERAWCASLGPTSAAQAAVLRELLRYAHRDKMTPNEERGIWRQMWEIAEELSRPRMPDHFCDADGRLHIKLPRRFQIAPNDHE